MLSHTGPGFHSVMEARGPVRSDSPLQGGRSALIHSFARSFRRGPLSRGRPSWKLLFPTVTTRPFDKNWVPLWMVGILWGDHCPTV